MSSTTDGFLYPRCRSAKGKDGRTIRVGDTVETIYGVTTTVVTLHNQGVNGIIARLAEPPDPEYPHHWTCQVSRTLTKKGDAQ